MSHSHRLAAVGVFVASLTVLGLMMLAQPAQAQYPVNNPLGVTIEAPGAADRCQEIEVVLDLQGEPRWVDHVELQWNGMSMSRAYCERAGNFPGPADCAGVFHPGLSGWGGSSGYRGRIHAFFIVTESPPARAWVQALYGRYDSGNTFLWTSEVSYITVSPAGAVNVDIGVDRTSLVADGVSTTTVSIACRDSACRGLQGQTGTLSTSLGRLRSGNDLLTSISFTTDASGKASATLVADTTPGTATLTASVAGGSGTTQVRMAGRQLDVTASPAAIPADDTTPSLISATLRDDTGQGVQGEGVTLSTNRGRLVGGGSSGDSIVVQTDSLGVAVATLKCAKPGMATVTASYAVGLLQLTRTTQVECQGYTLDLSALTSNYMKVAGRAGAGGLSAQTDVQQDGAIATLYGMTRIPVTITLSHGSASDVADKTINLRSAQKDAVGLPYISFRADQTDVSSRTTDASGKATFDLVVDQLWRAPVPVTTIVIVAEFADDTSVKAELEVAVKNNMQELIQRYVTAASIGSGPIWNPDVRAAIDAALRDSYREEFNTWYPGVQTDALAGAAHKYLLGSTDWNAQFLPYTAPYYQQKVLAFLHDLQWGPRRGAGDDRWLLNGLDWAGLYVEGGLHTAVVVYPRTGDGSTEAEWGPKASAARVFDPWPFQQPQTYTWDQWLDLLADPMLNRNGTGVRVQTHEFVAGMFGGTIGASHHYPANNRDYYDWNEDIPAPFDPTAAVTWVQNLIEGARLFVNCPVTVTMTDGRGRRSGYSSTGAAPLVDEIPGVQRTLLKKADGTLQWSFVLPPEVLTIMIEAHGNGPMTLSLVDPIAGRTVSYATTVNAGDTATVVADPQAQNPASLVFAGGRTVPGTSSPVMQPGVAPAKGRPTGGTRITVTGFAVSPGATVVVGGAAATDVTPLNGTTLAAVTSRAVRVGPVDVVVTSPGSAPVTLPKAFTYQPAPGLVDLNGDGVGDQVFYKAGTGQWAMTLADGQGNFAATIGQWSPDWTIRAGDFTGDGATDLFFYNELYGRWYLGVNNGQGSFQYLPGQWSAGWTVVVLDLNGDGRADVFVYNKVTGAWYQCLTTGPGTFAYFFGQWSPAWEVIPADLNGDGLGDLFVYNRTNGRWYRCLSTGTGSFTYAGGTWSPDWEIVAGDFDGDGLSDLLVYNVATGAWYRCRNTGTGFAYVQGQWSAGWTLRAGDFNGDGRADIFVYNVDNGRWYVCYHDEAGEFVYRGGTWSPGWAVHVTDLNADGREDLLVYNRETGRYYQCVATATLGVFDYRGGQWDPGWVLITTSGR